jgi:outer membrane murein-binding lipoprotein Lpp
MVLGEEAISWEKVIYVLGGAALGLIPQLWSYLLKKREEEPVLADRRQRVRAKDQTLEQAMQDHLFGKYQIMLESIQGKVEKLETDHLICQTENARLKERCDNQTTKIGELKQEVDKLNSRVEELEAHTGGV